MYKGTSGHCWMAMKILYKASGSKCMTLLVMSTVSSSRPQEFKKFICLLVQIGNILFDVITWYGTKMLPFGRSGMPKLESYVLWSLREGCPFFKTQTLFKTKTELRYGLQHEKVNKVNDISLSWIKLWFECIAYTYGSSSRCKNVPGSWYSFGSEWIW